MNYLKTEFMTDYNHRYLMVEEYDEVHDYVLQQVDEDNLIIYHPPEGDPGRLPTWMYLA